MLHASTSLFSLNLEQAIVCPLLVTLGLVPSDNSFRSLSRESLDRIIAEHQQCSCSLLEPAFFLAAAGCRRVCGTQHLFPDNAPECKYAALFDHRPSFDALRSSVYLGHELFVDVLDGLLAQNPNKSWRNQCQELLHLVRKYNSLSVELQPPHGFEQRVWPAFLDAITNTDYFFG